MSKIFHFQKGDIIEKKNFFKRLTEIRLKWQKLEMKEETLHKVTKEILHIIV